MTDAEKLKIEGLVKIAQAADEGTNIANQLVACFNTYPVAVEENNVHLMSHIREQVAALYERQLDTVDGIYAIAKAYNLTIPRRPLP